MDPHALQHVHTALGPAPRTFGCRSRWLNRVSPPGWVGFSHPFRDIYRFQREIFRNGDLMLAKLVQANSNLFERGRTDCPASVLVSRDELFERQPEALADLASRIFDLKGTVPADPDLRDAVACITSELDPKWHRIGPSAAWGREVWLGNIMIHRAHLPARILRQGFLPVLMHPKRQLLIMVPWWYWPDAECF